MRGEKIPMNRITLMTIICVAAWVAVSFMPLAAIAQSKNGQSTGERAQSEDAELAKKLQNPVANIISAPFQSNFDFGGGPEDDGFRYTLNVQPIIPFSLNKDWNLITRTIIPFVHQDKMINLDSQTGLGDIAQTFFLSPANPGSLIWGAGPVFLYPSASDDLLGTKKWGVGPSVVLLKQDKGWTFWTLANHIESFAGDGARGYVSLTYINPGISYRTKSLTTFLLQTESTYDWKADQWTVPINAGVTQLLKFGKLPVSIGLQVRIYSEKPDGAPDWGLRLVVTPVFTK